MDRDELWEEYQRKLVDEELLRVKQSMEEMRQAAAHYHEQLIILNFIETCEKILAKY